MESFISKNDSSAFTCEEHKAIFTENLEPYQILALTVPLDTAVWTERDEAWKICFYVYIAVMSAIFLKLGIVSIVMLIKKDCIRLPTKTFFAIYMSTAILGFSRALHLVLDPFGLVGFISDRFPAWFIVSRMLSAFGFPSLVASTTLMIFTLVKVAKAVPGKQWYHYWKFIILIMLTPYVIAFAAEFIANFNPYPGLVIVKVCELSFAVWGLVMCLTFIFAGNRLLRQLRLRGRKTVRVSTFRGTPGRDMESQMATRHEFASREQQRHQTRSRKTTRKITIITYGTALFTISYSLISIASAVMISILLYASCFGFQGREQSAIWLAFEFSKRANEIILTIVLLYSVTDVTGVLRVFFGKCCMTEVQRGRVGQCNKFNNLQKDSSTSILCTPERQGVRSTESLNVSPDQEGTVSDRSDENNVTNESQDMSTESIQTAEINSTETTPQCIPTITLTLSQPSSSGIELPTASQPLEITTPDEQIENERRETRRSRHSKRKSSSKTIGTQTTEQVDSAVQTEPNRIKPIPKKRQPKKSKNQILNDRRIPALRETPHTLTAMQNRITRKRTV
ncbi:uncharacterized protein LOC135333009 [Halichondria panicea]|uniref:uncharacterized protein LOC135333009 n=1 Tax=Halichondria panicea TaxID=6063 RepID=UPI00312B6933